MREWAFLGFAALGIGGSVQAKAIPAVSSAAEYYYRQHDFVQALPLWEEALQRDPDNPVALMRVGEMILWTDGRSTLPERFRPVIEKRDQTSSVRTLLKEKLRELQSIFLTDRAQNLFFQGKHRAARGDLRGALDCLNQAADLDRGQFLILSDRARLEKSLGSYDQYYQTLRLAVKSFPYDNGILTALAEAHLGFQNAKAALDTLQQMEGPLDPHRRLLLSVSLADTGQGALAVPLLRTLVGSKTGRCASPVACHALAQALASLGGNDAESRRWLERFTASVPTETAPTAWDPFRVADRLADARKQLARVP